MFARIKWEPFGLFEKIEECETEEDFYGMVAMLVRNKVWFDVDFPDRQDR